MRAKRITKQIINNFLHKIQFNQFKTISIKKRRYKAIALSNSQYEEYKSCISKVILAIYNPDILWFRGYPVINKDKYGNNKAKKVSKKSY